MEIALAIFFGTIFGIGGLGALVYIPAKDDWNKLFARAAQIGRANLGSKNSRLGLEFQSKPVSNQLAVRDWQAEYEGRKELALVNQEFHVIVRSWNEINDNYYEGVEERWFWECACGEKQHRKNKEAGRNSARRHLELMGGRNEAGVRDEGWLRGKGF
jgi:hypothetical protein